MTIEHRWDIPPKQAVQLQRELADKVRIDPLQRDITLVSGTDCAFLGKKQVLAGAVLCDAQSWDVLAAVDVVRPCLMPYVPGLLSFREAPAVIDAINALPEAPDLLMCDGQGLAHPRGMGLASHVGLLTDLPTIGVAKSRYCGEHRQPGPNRGNRAQLKLDKKVIGTVLRTRTNVKPLFVSVGHRVTLGDAIRWTFRGAGKFRLPEPTRQAHLHVTRRKKEILSQT
ncbi:MAG: endonuclease V [Phycisphaerae bacterium]